MQETSILNDIRSMLPVFSETERKFAEYVLRENELIYKSITMATEESGVGYGTIIRFCQKLKCKGFQDFKIKLALEPSQKESDTPPDEDSFLASVCKDIRTVNEAIDPSVFERAVKILVPAKKYLSSEAAALMLKRGTYVIGLCGSALTSRLKEIPICRRFALQR